MRNVKAAQLARPEYRLALVFNEALKIALRPMRLPQDAGEDVVDVDVMTRAITAAGNLYDGTRWSWDPQVEYLQVTFRDVRNKPVVLPVGPNVLHPLTTGVNPERVAQKLALEAYHYLTQVDGYSANKIDMTVEL